MKTNRDEGLLLVDIVHHTKRTMCCTTVAEQTVAMHGLIVALYLYPLDACLYSQLLHRPPGMGDVIGAVSLRRHPGQISTAMKNKKEEA